MKLKTRMQLSIIGSVILVFVFIMAYIINYSYTSAKETANEIAVTSSIQRAQVIERELNQAITVARELAKLLELEKSNSYQNRDRASDLIEDLLTRHQDLLGVWTCWEPNTFEGDDAIWTWGQLNTLYYYGHNLIKLDYNTGEVLKNITMKSVMDANPGIDIFGIRQADTSKGSNWLSDQWHGNDIDPLPKDLEQYYPLQHGDIL